MSTNAVLIKGLIIHLFQPLPVSIKDLITHISFHYRILKDKMQRITYFLILRIEKGIEQCLVQSNNIRVYSLSLCSFFIQLLVSVFFLFHFHHFLFVFLSWSHYYFVYTFSSKKGINKSYLYFFIKLNSTHSKFYSR